MGDDASWSERRCALRVPVHGVAICYTDALPVRGTIENLSSSGALVSLGSRSLAPTDAPDTALVELELKLGSYSGHVVARTVRVERTPRRTRIAVVFDRVDDHVRAAIEAAICHAIAAAARRPVLVIDEDADRRARLLARLAEQGMTPLPARTPLDAIDLLTNPQLLVCVCVLAPSFGHSLSALHALVSDSFPWVRATDISDDLAETVDRARHAWSSTDIARLARAIA